MRHLRKRLCSLLLCAVLVAGLLPMSGRAYADASASSNASNYSLTYSYATYDTPAERAEAVNKLRYRFLGEMLSHIGCDYVKGKGHFANATTFDCSGLVAHAFISIGYSRYFSVSDKKWDPGNYRAYDCNGKPSSDWKDFSWRGSRGFYENVKDGQKVYLIPDSSKNPVLVFTVRKAEKKADYVADISNPNKWPEDFRNSASARGTILVKNHVSQTKWHVTTVVGYYDQEWFSENGYDINPAKASLSTVKKAIREDLIEEFKSYGLSSKVLTRVHRGLANGTLNSDNIGGKNTNSSFNDLDREDDVYPAMWDLRQRRITSEWKYSPLWQIDALNPRMGVSINNSTLAANQDSSITMLLEWEEFGECHLNNYDDASRFGGEDKPIAGAVYGVYAMGKEDTYEALAELKPLETATADENGLVLFSGLPVDGITHENSYRVIELTPPDGCEPNRNVYSVTVTREGDSEIVEGGIVTSTILTGFISMQLDKLNCLADADRGTWDGRSVGAYTLTGKTVRTAGVSNPAGTLYDAAVAYRILADGDVMFNGQVLYPSGSLVGTAYGSANGTVSSDDLPYGNYTVCLRTTPLGWSDTSPVGATRVSVTLSADQDEVNRLLASSKLQLQLRFHVTDALNRPISGGLFVLRCEQDIYDYSGSTLLIAAGNPIAVGTAGTDGLVRFTASAAESTSEDTADDALFALLPVNYLYYLTELEAPDGFLPLDGNLVEFTYVSPEWSGNSTAERSFRISYMRAPIVEETLTRDLTEEEEVRTLPLGPSPVSAASLPLFSLLTLLGAATYILCRRNRFV